ncbi:MAG: hypothetical protein ACTSQJ_08320 [Promethearchaeota archaeon]
MCGQIIRKFKDLFNKNLNSFLEGNYLEFLLNFTKIKGISEKLIKDIYKSLEKKLESLKDINLNIQVLYTIVLSSIISKIREYHFNKAIKEVRRRTAVLSNINSSLIQKKLDGLFMRNNGNISLLYNISYLEALAESFNYKKIARICKIQKGKYINRVVNHIISS